MRESNSFREAFNHTKHTFYHAKNLIKESISAATSIKNYKPIDNFLEEEWGNLVILDGCRYDMLKEKNPFNTETGKVYSNASHTLEFLRKNLKERDNSDIVYVTASPQVARMDLGLHHRFDVWHDHWNEEHGTVMPEDVTKAGIDAIKRYPNKRVIVHYMQPHYPFIGEKGNNMGSPIHDGFFGKKKKTVWEQLGDGELSEEELKEAYYENLEIVLGEAEKLVSHMEGKTVVTSDHGNVYGKRIGLSKVYGHGYGWSDKEVAKVGWIELEK